MSWNILPKKEIDQSSFDRILFVKSLKPGAHIHISGVCGTGTASVLTLLKQLGYHVTGSDKAFYPPMGDVVKSEADKVYQGYAVENLSPRPELVVIGNSLSKNNPEVEYVMQNEIPFASMPEVFLALLIGNRDECATSIVVAGTHGKSTTTAAVTNLLDQAKLRPGFFVGGIAKNLSTSIRPVDKNLPLEKRYVVLEGDEYDSAFFSKYPKFHSYRPDILIITSLEFDHADIYNNVEEIEEEFTKLVRNIPITGKIIINDSGPSLEKLYNSWKNDNSIKAPIYRYGTKQSSEFRINQRLQKGQNQEISISLQATTFNITTELTGPHNALNLLATAAVGNIIGLTSEQIISGIASFRGVLRRQHLIGEFNGVTLIEDFAHHPTAVKVTLQGIKEANPNKRIICVYEPRSNTARRAFFQKDYVSSFSPADIILLLEVKDAGGYSATSSEITALDVKQLVADLVKMGKIAFSFKEIELILGFIQTQVKVDDLIVIMSNGDFGGLLKKLEDLLSKL